jgi:hypothetical protein
METIIHTVDGTYIVPRETYASLVHWLQHNAVKAEYKVHVKEQSSTFGSEATYEGTQLLAD